MNVKLTIIGVIVYLIIVLTVICFLVNIVVGIKNILKIINKRRRYKKRRKNIYEIK